MTSQRSNAAYSSTSSYNIYSTINNSNSPNNLLIPRSAIGGRSPSPIDAELTNLKKEGKDYHVSVNLNSLISTNLLQPRPQSRIALGQNNILNQQTVHKSNSRSLKSNQTHTQNYLDRFPDVKNIHRNQFGSSRTVLAINGMDDSEVYELHNTHQRNLLTVAPTPKPPTSYSLTPPISISPQVNSQESGYAVKSVSSSNAHQINGQRKNERVEFDLHLRSQLQKEAPAQKKWEVVGTVPIQHKNQTLPRKIDATRTGTRAINDDDEVDANIRKDTAKELEDLLLCHPLIRDTPGDNIRIERQKDQLVDPPSNPSEGLVNMDIIEERVEIVMKNDQALVLVRVTCSRTVPLENSRYFKKSSVMVIKSMDFDMMESDERRDLYRNALQKQNLDPEGRLDQQETNRLYKALMKVIKTEESSGMNSKGIAINSRISNMHSHQPVNENDYGFNDYSYQRDYSQNVSNSNLARNQQRNRKPKHWNSDDEEEYYPTFRTSDNKKRDVRGSDYFMY